MATTSRNTASRYMTEHEIGTHTFYIEGFSLNHGIGANKFVHSTVFNVVGYDWQIRFFPNGMNGASKDQISVNLALVSNNASCLARYELSLLHQIKGDRLVVHYRIKSRLFVSSDDNRMAPSKAQFLDVRGLEQDSYLLKDCLTIECTVTVVKKSLLSKVNVKTEIEVPPCDIAAQFARLLNEKVGADITFQVKSVTFEAHKTVLAARSHVFKAIFHGGMKEAMTVHETVEITDMKPEVFKVVLHFIYTGSLCGLDHIDIGRWQKMMFDLLAAADMYELDRLKLLRENILSKELNAETVFEVISVADKHNCAQLKEACIAFISSANVFDVLLESKCYAGLKKNCPDVVVDILEKTSKRRRC